MGLALHPYIVGQPYRLRHLRTALAHLAHARDRGDIWFTTPGEIAAHMARLARNGRGVRLRRSQRVAGGGARCAFPTACLPFHGPFPLAAEARATQARRRTKGKPSSHAEAATPAADDGDIEERIYRSVFEGVTRQRLAPGTKLPEAALCELFGVSRALVRKVLQRLAHDHIVELRPNRGAIVAMPSPEETRQIFEARRALEAALVRMAVRNATKAEVAELRRHLKEEHAAMHRYTQPDWARLAVRSTCAWRGSRATRSWSAT
jgi:DNA-binding transcriptional regulator YhcF (GntR family)